MPDTNSQKMNAITSYNWPVGFHLDQTNCGELETQFNDLYCVLYELPSSPVRCMLNINMMLALLRLRLLKNKGLIIKIISHCKSVSS